ncbi:hypothetical protein P4S72_03780 [Vibrio sp. PP-XX7]
MLSYSEPIMPMSSVFPTRHWLTTTKNRLAKEKGWQRAAIGTAGRWHAAFQQGLYQLDVSEFAHTIDTWKTELFTQVDVGLTHVLAGIADTGPLCYGHRNMNHGPYHWCPPAMSP